VLTAPGRSLAAAVAVGIGLAGCGSPPHPPPAAPVRKQATARAPMPPPRADSRVERQLAGMSLDVEVGQVFMPYVYGSTATTTDPTLQRANLVLAGVRTPAEMLARYHVGGLVLLDHQPLDPRMPALSTHNVDSPATVSRLTSSLAQTAVALGLPPLLVGTDQEGGTVSRLGPPYSQYPSQRALAAGPGAAAAVAREFRGLAAELVATGVNVDFAPVADVNTNPRNPVIGSRAYGSDTATVERLVGAAVRACSATPLLCVAKHFPGHGSTGVDSHVALPTVTESLATLQRVDLPPFAAAVRAGVPMIMVGHLLVPALDPALPASLSPVVIGYLRHQLGFSGVIVTDGLSMGALRGRYSDGDIAVRALAAGADVLLEPADLRAAVSAVKAAVSSGRLPKSRLDDAVRRVLILKQRLPPAPTP